MSISREPLHVMTKPIGPICNLDCEYCYYLHKEDLYDRGERWRMSSETLEQYIRQYILAQPSDAPEVTFAWQGGEPTLLGIDFFQHALDLQRRYQRSGQAIVNTIQTNGVLLDDRWCDFLRRNEFLVGLSIDGPADLHDRYRYDKQGQPTFDAVMRGMRLLQKHEVEYNLLVVVNRHNGDHGRRIYKYLRDSGGRFFQFIPIVERRGIGVHGEAPPEDSSDPMAEFVSSRSVRSEQFGRFLIEVFDEWLYHDVGRVYVQIVEEAVRAWLGNEPALCIFRKRCGRAMAMEHNGDLYSCDHFVEPEHRLGNIHDLPILDMADSDQQNRFGADKESTLPDYCRRCEVQFVCNGECPKNRFMETPDGEANLNYLCAGYRTFFNHIDPSIRRIVEEIRHGRPALNVMHQLINEKKPRRRKRRRMTIPGARDQQQANGRNDPCPCGSGKKYKKCCMR